jgi:hypothetical protein
VTWTGGDPQVVLFVVREALCPIADGLEGVPIDE